MKSRTAIVFQQDGILSDTTCYDVHRAIIIQVCKSGASGCTRSFEGFPAFRRSIYKSAAIIPE